MSRHNRSSQPEITLLAALALVGLLLGCRTPSPPTLVEDVDLERYLGRWYEIASYPQHFQRGCVATQARYSRRADGRIRVENQCRDGTLEGEVRRAEGVAWAEEGDPDAKLRVRFFWPFWGHYWIIALDPDYRWAVVGHPERKYLWILSRSPTLAEPVYQEILARVRAQGYALDRLERTLQPTAP